jgi:hypothetical protein
MDELVDTSYEVLDASIDSPLDKILRLTFRQIGYLWNKKTGQLNAPPKQILTTDMSFDGMRVPWRIALDWQWFKEPRAKRSSFKNEFLSKEWSSNSLLYTKYP